MFTNVLTNKQIEELKKAADKVSESEIQVFENAYNLGLKHGWRNGIILMLLAILANIIIVYIVFNSPFR